MGKKVAGLARTFKFHEVKSELCCVFACVFLASPSSPQKKKLLPKNRHSIWVTTSWSYPISTLTPERDINGKETRTKGTFDHREKPRQASAAVVGRRRCCRSRVWGEYSHRCWSFSARFFAPSFRHHAIILSSNHRHTFRGFTANIFAWQKRRKPGLADEGCESGGIFCVAVKKELLAFSSARRARNWKAGWAGSIKDLYPFTCALSSPRLEWHCFFCVLRFSLLFCLCEQKMSLTAHQAKCTAKKAIPWNDKAYFILRRLHEAFLFVEYKVRWKFAFIIWSIWASFVSTAEPR